MTQGESYATVSRFVQLSVWENLTDYKGQLCTQFIKAPKDIFYYLVNFLALIDMNLLRWVVWLNNVPLK